MEMTSREFRANLKDAFEAALDGLTVTVTRNEQEFLLVSKDAVKAARTQKQVISEAGVMPEDAERTITSPEDGNIYLQHTPMAENPFYRRTIKDVLAEIDAIKAELATGINQDPDYHAEQNDKVRRLWEEYHSLKGE